VPVASSSYTPPPLLGGGHVQTLFASLVRRVEFDYDGRECVDTPDGDVLELEWAFPPGRACCEGVVLLTHGLEGDTQRRYMRGMARAFVHRGWAVCAWNLRGCGRSMNRRPITYHSGKTEDLACVVEHVRSRGHGELALVGFSLGGNLTLKFLGEQGAHIDDSIRGAVVFSVPVDLEAASHRIDHWSNKHYTQYFLRSLRQKIREKAEQHPERVRTGALEHAHTLRAFDDAYTAPLNGFYDADTYYRRASCRPFLADIAVPTLLVNAANDPFLPDACYPEAIASNHSTLTLEVPESGGHVGFVSLNETGEYWSERRAAAFLTAR